MTTIARKRKLVRDEDIYNELLKSEVDGKIIASEKQQKSFEKWLEK